MNTKDLRRPHRRRLKRLARKLYRERLAAARREPPDLLAGVELCRKQSAVLTYYKLRARLETQGPW